MSVTRRFLVWSIGFALIASAPGASYAQARPGGQPFDEYEVKAAFLFNFAKFVAWPEGVVPAAPAPIVIGILGEDPFGAMLEDVTSSERVNGREILVRRLGPADDPRSCPILFISESEHRRLPEIFARLKGANVLTVGDVEGFTGAGGVIRLTREDSRVGLEISLAAAERAGLRISSRLLSLAHIVEFGSEHEAQR